MHAPLLRVFVCVLGFVLLACANESKISAINHDLIAAINAKTANSWTAGVNENFNGWTIAEVKSLLGWKKPQPEQRLRPLMLNDVDVSALPTSFTSADNWPKCRTIRTIYNQARCGSCWAFGGIESISDRFCISSQAAFNEILSFGQVTECSAGGCDGGSAEITYDFVQSNGVVTGSCYPYNIPTCPPAQQPCLNFVNTPDCWSNRTCSNGQPWQKYHLKTAYSLQSPSQAMQDMFTNGPIEACFDVYADFLNYKSGVYQHQSGDFLGGHCIKIQGWGVENGLPYWLINNSWTTYWGDNGQVKILRGQDECGIEDDMVAGLPQWPPQN